MLCLLTLRALIVPAAHDSISIGKNMVVDDRNQTGIIKLFQYFKQAVPFSSRKLAHKVVYLGRSHVCTEMDATVLHKMIMRLFITTEIFFQWVPPLPSNSLVQSSLVFRDIPKTMINDDNYIRQTGKE